MSTATAPAYTVESIAGTRPRPAAFSFQALGPQEAEALEKGDIYSAALAFIEDRIDVEGDLFAALRALVMRPRSSLRNRLLTLIARLDSLRWERWSQGRARARSNIEFHYDHPAAFYRQFLDARMVYSCAYFEDPQWTLEEAQLAKLDLICRKLGLCSGERFLDIGCGWGALVFHAVANYGVRATGCTLSRRQSDAPIGWQDPNAAILYRDYRDFTGRFDKIASVGMFEHVGIRRLPEYFRKMAELLADDGLFLNHGIARPRTVKPGPDWIFLQKRVFPGGDLPPLDEVVRQAEIAGFEVLDVENLRPHYALTCRTWVERLRANEEACRTLVGGKVYRTWLLYLAASAVCFADGYTDVHQVLMAKRAHPAPRRLSRREIYS
ncbi:MAG: class I SAM-dependent methyltransferase [Bryobacteraceae bacterium]